MKRISQDTNVLFTDVFDARFNEVRHEYAHANSGAAFRSHRLCVLLHRLARG